MARAGDILKQTRVARLIEEALALETEEAQAAGALGFMARALVQATMPHRKPAPSEFVRRNSAFTLTIIAPSEVGLPYGRFSRSVDRSQSASEGPFGIG